MTHQVITQDGEPVEYLAHYWRHHVEYTLSYPTPEEAASFLINGSEMSDLAAVGVIYPDGRTRDAEEVYREFRQKELDA